VKSEKAPAGGDDGGKEEAGGEERGSEPGVGAALLSSSVVFEGPAAGEEASRGPFWDPKNPREGERRRLRPWTSLSLFSDWQDEGGGEIRGKGEWQVSRSRRRKAGEG